MKAKRRRMAKINAFLEKYGFESMEACRDLCLEKGIDVEKIVKGVQPIAFENAVWAYTLGVALALKLGKTNAADASETIGEGLEAFCIPGSVAEERNVGRGHGNLGAMLLREETDCFCFLAGPRVLRRRRGSHRHRPAPPTRPARPRSGSSSTALARTPPTSSPASTASPTLRPSTTSPPTR